MKRLATLATTSILACGTFAAPSDFATRVACELQTASGTSLQRLIWQQGTTPLLSIEQFRLGKAIPADPETEAIVVFGPSATNRYFVAVTNHSRTANGYLVQMPTIGTNAAAWWYTVYFERGGRRYWTGSGALAIEATTSTGDGLVWQTITGVSVAALQSALDAEAQARAAGDLVAMTNWQARVNTLTNGAALGETALQPAATNDLAAAAAHAATAHGVTEGGGFQGGENASADLGGAVGSGAYTITGGAVGSGAYATYGGAVGNSAYTEYGGAVGHTAYTMGGGAVGYGAASTDGGAVGYRARTSDGGAVGRNATTSDGFAGGLDAFATTDGTGNSEGIDAIQLGTGGNTEPFTLQVYGNRLLNADGTIPVARMTAHNTDGTAHADIRALVGGATTNLLAELNAAIAKRATWPGATNAAEHITGEFAKTGTVARAEEAERADNANMAAWAAEAMEAETLNLGSPQAQTIDAARQHINDPAGTAHPDIRSKLAEIESYVIGDGGYITISNSTMSISRITTNDTPEILWTSEESSGGGGVDTNLVNSLLALIDTKAPKAWGNYAPDGSPNPDPEYMTFLNRAVTMFASGYTWASYGAYACLSQTGSVAYETGTNGTVRWSLDDNNYFGFRKSGSIIVGCKARGITVTEGGTSNGVASIVYPYEDGDFPVLWYSPALGTPFSIAQDGVVWVDNLDGTATVSAPATAPRGFWYATSTVSVDSVWEVTAPAQFHGGVIASTNAAPVIFNSVIEIQQDGKRYRVPAQEVR